MSEEAKVYAVMNRKGGVGKTTTAVTLGVGLAQKLASNGSRPAGSVLIVDLDPQGNVASSFQIRMQAGKTLGDVLLKEATLKESVVRAAPRPNLFILPSNDSLEQARRRLALEEAMALTATVGRPGNHKREDSIDTVLSRRLGIARRAFEFILLDCPPSLNELTNAVLDFADAAIVPVKPDYLGTTGTAQHTKNILDAQEEGVDIKIAWFLPTFYRGREILAQQMLRTLISTYGKDKVATPIPQAAAVEQAPASSGQTILEYDPSSPAAVAYAEFVERVYNG